jgi:hypothetical protein
MYLCKKSPILSVWNSSPLVSATRVGCWRDARQTQSLQYVASPFGNVVGDGDVGGGGESKHSLQRTADDY